MSTKELNAVWKAVDEGNDTISIKGVAPFLKQKDILNKIHVYSSLESTNKTAKEMALSAAEHGTVVIADYQTAGKGRYGRTFYSPQSHGIYMSLILHPIKLSLSTPALVTHFAAVSVCEAIESISDKKPQIKWVNDIFLNKKKICGILTEAITDIKSGNIQGMVVGIGINFSTPTMGFPDDLRQIAGAVFEDGKPSITRNHLIGEIINRILFLKNQYSNQELLDKYRKRLMMLGENILVTGPNKSYEAIAIDIDDAGQLIIKKDNDEVISLSSCEIRVRNRLPRKI